VRGENARQDRKPDGAADIESPAGFERLVEEYQRKVYGMAWRITGDPEAAWDIAQETFLRAWKKRQRLRKVSNVPGYIFRIASNLSIDHLRRKARAPNPEPEFWEMQEDDRPGAPAGVAEEESLIRIRRALLRLTDRERDAFLLKHWEGMKIREVADSLGCREGTVKSLIHRAVGKLRKELRGRV
jgi:RNA polymerase sigma-70 factor (ECF subfamily)